MKNTVKLDPNNVLRFEYNITVQRDFAELCPFSDNLIRNHVCTNSRPWQMQGILVGHSGNSSSQYSYRMQVILVGQCCYLVKVTVLLYTCITKVVIKCRICIACDIFVFHKFGCFTASGSCTCFIFSITIDVEYITCNSESSIINIKELSM